jgi:D-inositol-3-phosphate glycosyltransferase
MIAMRSSDAAAARVAMISLHTSPLDQPGIGDSGGMNVEIRAVADRLAARGVAVDVFTRCAGREVPQVERVGPLTRVVQVPAGPCAEVAKVRLPALVPAFAQGVVRSEHELGPYDLVHTHYWLSGPAGMAAARRWDVPLVASFHTLAEVKNLALGEGDAREPVIRALGERRVIRAADRVLAPTEEDARHLMELYDAERARIRVLPPGVDLARFSRRDSRAARARLGLGDGPVILFVGRLQPLKGPDLAVRAFADAARRAPEAMRDAVLLMVGGRSGPRGEAVRPWLESVAAEEGVARRVRFLGPRAHEELPWVYSAADVFLMPSRSESFGLAALEAQACGVPVVAAGVGGLLSAVRHGVGGYLMEGRDPRSYGAALNAILSSNDLAGRMSRAGVTYAAGFPWDVTASRLIEVYGELLPVLASARAS